MTAWQGGRQVYVRGLCDSSRLDTKWREGGVG